MKKLLDLMPKTKELLEKAKAQPTNEQRITALENAVADLAIQTMGVDANA